MNKVEELEIQMKEAALADETAKIMDKVLTTVIPIMLLTGSPQAVLYATGLAVVEKFREIKMPKELKNKCFNQLLEMMRFSYER